MPTDNSEMSLDAMRMALASPRSLYEAGMQGDSRPSIQNQPPTYMEGVGERIMHLPELMKAEVRRWSNMDDVEKGIELGTNLINPGPGMALATAWHGSPHLFKKFAMEAIGTGEGAQSRGHGLYLAEAQDVAGEYATKLSEPVTTFGGKQISEIANPESKRLAEWIQSNVGVMQFDARHGEANRLFNRLKPEQQAALGKPSVSDTGNLYKTDIPDAHIDKMLDWDKPINEQSPYVLEALNKAGINTESSSIAGPMAMGQESHLAKHGIPGIKYLDGSSRTAGEGTRNFVMFNPDDIRILERNGVSTGEKPWADDAPTPPIWTPIDAMHKPAGTPWSPRNNYIDNPDYSTPTKEQYAAIKKDHEEAIARRAAELGDVQSTSEVPHKKNGGWVEPSLDVQRMTAYN
jgi:hypothetical protein